MTIAGKTRERPDARPVSKQRLRLWLRLLRSSRAIESRLRERLRAKFAITLPQFDVMATLARYENGMTMTELSRRLMVSNGNVTGIIDRLVAEKLVLRQAPASDRRAPFVPVMPEGGSPISKKSKAHEKRGDDKRVEIEGPGREIATWRLDGLVRRVRNGEARP